MLAGAGEDGRLARMCDPSVRIDWLDAPQRQVSVAAADAGTVVRQWNFFHIPKCAGTSLAQALVKAATTSGLSVCDGTIDADRLCTGPRLGQDALVIGHQYHGLVPEVRSGRCVATKEEREQQQRQQQQQLAAGSPSTSSSSSSSSSSVFFSPRPGSASAYVTVLRHPVSRVKSLYYYIRSNPNHWAYAATNKQTIIEFVQVNPEATNEMTRMLCGPRWRRKEYARFDGGAQAVAERCAADGPFAVARAKRHLDRDFAAVGVQECFTESAQLIYTAIPWARPLLDLKGKDERPPPPHSRTPMERRGNGKVRRRKTRRREGVPSLPSSPVSSTAASAAAATGRRRATAAAAAVAGGSAPFVPSTNVHDGAQPRLSKAEVRAVLARNGWDLEVYAHGLRAFRAGLLRLPGAEAHAAPPPP